MFSDEAEGIGAADAAKKPTVADIAAALGISAGAVSFALNNKPGVSEETRMRVFQAASELGWEPRRHRRRAGEPAMAVGLALRRRAASLAIESFYAQFTAGLETELAKRSWGLLWQIVDSPQAELDVYARWRRLGTVDGVILVDVTANDPRVARLAAPGGLPAIVVGDASVAGGLSSVSVDDTAATRSLIRRLAELGHQKIVRISGPTGSAYTEFRDTAMRETAAELGVSVQIERSDLSARSAALITRGLVRAHGRPTAIIYESDVMALAGQGVVREFGIRVPAELSIVAWDDSPLCVVAHPQISAMSRDVLALGSAAVGRLFDVIDGAPPTATAEPAQRLLERGTTGRAPAPAS